MRQLKAALVGCGGFGNRHLNDLLQMEEVQVTALCSRSEDRLRRTGEKAPQARLYRGYREMFEREKLDFAVISTIPSGHEEIEETAAAHGVHFYVEKPVGLSREAVEKKLQAVKKAGILTSVGYQERYNPKLRELEALLSQHPALMAYGGWIGEMPGVSWWRKKECSGGQLVEQCTHIFDFMRYLFGEAKTVSTVARSDLHGQLPDCSVDDCAVSSVSFQSGAVASVMTGCFQGPGAPGFVGLTLVCQNGVVEYDWGKSFVAKTSEGETRVEFPGDHHRRALAAFVQAVGQQDPSLIRSDYADGAASLFLSLAAQQSADEGRVIAL